MPLPSPRISKDLLNSMNSKIEIERQDRVTHQTENLCFSSSSKYDVSCEQSSVSPVFQAVGFSFEE